MAVFADMAHTFLYTWLSMPVGMAIGVSALAWAMVLLAFWMNPWCSIDFKKQAADRFMSTVHALVAGVLGLGVEALTDPQCTTRMTWVSAVFLMFLGYLAVDLVSMCICDVWQAWRPVDKSMILHHVFILSFFTLGYVVDVGVWFGSALLINELSTPFVNVFWYLKYIGQKESKAFKINGTVLLLTFFVFRILYIPFNFWHFQAHGLCLDSENPAYQHLSWLMLIGYVAIYLINLFWFSKLVRGALQALQKKEEKPVGAAAALIDARE